MKKVNYCITDKEIQGLAVKSTLGTEQFVIINMATAQEEAGGTKLTNSRIIFLKHNIPVKCTKAHKQNKSYFLRLTTKQRNKMLLNASRNEKKL